MADVEGLIVSLCQNLANDAEAMRTSGHPGWVWTAWDGLQQTVEVASEKRVKIVINGGSLNPKGLGTFLVGIRAGCTCRFADAVTSRGI